jgi:DnaJ-class molecular chaperone
MADPYSVLGVSRTASQDDIRKAYRKLAKQYHPDLHKGNKALAEKFKDISAANAIIGDPAQRAKFDGGELDENGQPRSPFGRGGPRGGGGTGARAGPGPGGFGFDPEDMFADLFGRMKRPRTRAGRIRGLDVRYNLAVDFLDAARGTVKRLTLPGGKTLDVTIPAGIETGQIVRLKGQGEISPNEGENGDALIEIAAGPHAFFRREGADIHIEVPISLTEAVEGAKIQVPTVDGTVAMTVPKGANTGARLRLKGKGIAADREGNRGDQFVTLRIVLPDEPDAELVKFVEKWSRRGYDVRRRTGMG